jgi:hypothetical protein
METYRHREAYFGDLIFQAGGEDQIRAEGLKKVHFEVQHCTFKSLPSHRISEFRHSRTFLTRKRNHDKIFFQWVYKNAAVSGEFSIRVVPSQFWRRRGSLRH